MRDTTATSLHIDGDLEVSLEAVIAANGRSQQGRSMMQLHEPGGTIALLTVFADDAVLARLALDLLELLPIKTIAWEQARRQVVPVDDPFGVPTTDLTAAELGAKA